MKDSDRTQSFRRRLIRGGLWLSVGRVFAHFSIFATHVLLAKFCLTSDDFGRYLAIAAVAQITAVIAGFGIPPIVMRTIRESLNQQEPRRSAEAIVRGGRLLLVIATIVAVVLAMLLHLARPEKLGESASWMAMLVGGWVFFVAVNQFISETFTGTEHYERAILLGGENGGLVQNVVLMVGGCLLGWLGLGSLTNVVLLNLFGLALATAISLGHLIWVLRSFASSNEELVDSRQTTMSTAWIAAESLPAMLRSLLRICAAQLDVVFVAGFLPATQVAAYGAARALVRLASSPLRLTNVALAPFVPELNAAGDKLRLETLLRAAATSAGVPAIMALLALVIAPEFFLRLAFKDEFVVAARALQIIAAGSIAFVAVGGVGMVLLMTGHQRVSLYSALAVFVLQIILTPLLIQGYGMVGAAAASAMLIVTRSMISMLLVRFYVGVWSTMTFSYRQVREFTGKVLGRRFGKATTRSANGE